MVVGARCAGATVATLLARAGQRVLLVDRDTFPSDTVSTHQLFPDSLDLLDQLGAGDRLRAAHCCGRSSTAGGCSGTRWPEGSRRSAATTAPAPSGASRWTPCWSRRPRRLARSSGWAARSTDLIGSGTADDPVRGVVLRSGERVEARWVIGADGRTSTVARRLGAAGDPAAARRDVDAVRVLGGLPDADWCQIDVHEQLALMSAPCEDGVHLLSVAGPAGADPRIGAERQETYLAALRRFPATSTPGCSSRADRSPPSIAVPETMLRGFVRPANGPGWALVGDAGLFKHPVTAQGIGDALAQGWYVGQRLGRGEISPTTRPGAPTGPPATTTGRSRPPASRPRAPRRSTRGWPPTPRPARSSSTSSPSGIARARC